MVSKTCWPGYQDKMKVGLSKGGVNIASHPGDRGDGWRMRCDEFMRGW